MERVIAMFFTAYLGTTFRCYGQYILWKGAYPLLLFQRMLKEMKGCWIAFGYAMNFLIIMSTAVCSVVILFSSSSVIDILINAFALFWIHELDDRMVSYGDYGTIRNTLRVHGDIDEERDLVQFDCACLYSS